MATIETVTGPIDPTELGTTLIHEHLLARDEAVHAQWPDAGTIREHPPHAVEPGGEYDEAVRAAERAVGLGVRSICDPTAMFLGRDVAFMRRVAERTGLQVVPCTGIYSYDHLPSFLVSRDADQIADLFVADIERGVQGTEIKAAFVKCAADEPGVTENVEKIHRAAARASLRTGAPIMAHSRPASLTAPRQIEIFVEEGVDPSRVQIAHTGDTDDLDYIERVLETGVFIGMDRYGLELYLPFENRNRTVLALLERGHTERMFISADSCATIDWFPPGVVEQMIAAGMAKDWHIGTVHERVIPTLTEGGMSDDQLETMLVRNPVAWLTGA
ncbi:MAG: phosphotriesterase [Solirubrobacterales bacterium]|nr:phosphotriesterase [Solirubrobacterales bacterium]